MGILYSILCTLHNTLASHTDFTRGVLGERLTVFRIDEFDFQIREEESYRVFLRNSMAFTRIPMSECDAAVLCQSICLAKNRFSSKFEHENFVFLNF